MPTQVIPIRSSSQQFIEIEDIDHDLIMFIDGSCSLILSTTAVNFGLLSEKEQENMIYAYAGILNSLSFPIQILMRSQHKDITAYLQLLADAEAKQKNPKLARSIHSYRQFVSETVKAKEVLDKNFFIVIPFSSLELGASANVLLGNRKRGLPYSKDYVWDKAQTVLLPKRDHLLRLFSRLGLRAHQLDTSALIKTFFASYNPGSPLPELDVIAAQKPTA